MKILISRLFNTPSIIAKDFPQHPRLAHATYILALIWMPFYIASWVIAVGHIEYLLLVYIPLISISAAMLGIGIYGLTTRDAVKINHPPASFTLIPTEPHKVTCRNCGVDTFTCTEYYGIYDVELACTKCGHKTRTMYPYYDVCLQDYLRDKGINHG